MREERREFAAIVLAAGRGKRMGSALPKVLHQIGDKSMVEWVIQTARKAGAARVVVVIGYGRDQVVSVLPSDVETAVQDRQHGSGHAVHCAASLLADWNGPIAVLSGDVPLLRPDTLWELVGLQAMQDAAVAVLTAKTDDGRPCSMIIRDRDGRVRRVASSKESPAGEGRPVEGDTGVYVFGPGKLFAAVAECGAAEGRKGAGVADCITYYARRGETVATLKAPRRDEVLGIDTPQELAAAERALQERRKEGPPEEELAGKMRIFAGNGNPRLAKDICACLRIPAAAADIGRFPDGETKVQIHDDVRGRDVFVIQSTCPPVNDNLIELLVMIDAVKRASADRVTAVIPYFGYARQDRKHAGRVPITAKLVANLIVEAGADRILCMDLHATQIQGFFDIPVDHLYAAPVHLAHLRELNIPDLTVLSPDPGRIKMANAFAKRLDAGLAVIDKRRTGDSTVERGHVVGDIKDRNVLIVDDMISTGGSVGQAVHTALNFRAKGVMVMVTHPVFCGRAFERFNGLPVTELCVTNTIPIKKKPENVNLVVLDVAPLLAEAIKRTHRNESISRLFVQ